MRRLALAAVLLASAACRRQKTPSGLPPVTSFRVTANRLGGAGTPDQRLPLPTFDSVQVSAQALNADGSDNTDYAGTASIRATPGISTKTAVIHFSGGKGVANVSVSDDPNNGLAWIRNVFGKTVIWVEDVSYDANGRPNPGSGFGTGVSQPIWYASPTIYDIQHVTTQNDQDALPGAFVTVSEDALPQGEQMDMIVTQIFQDGFYVTDLKTPPSSDTTFPIPHGFGHIYVYSYSYPEDLVVGDRLSVITGTVSEFSGDTQLGFPSWHAKTRPDVSLDELRKDVPPPVDLTRALCIDQDSSTALFCGGTKGNLSLEAAESAPARVGKVEPMRASLLCDTRIDTWQASQAYAVGAQVVATTSQAHLYQVIGGGTSAATEPVWPTAAGGQVTDGTVTWKEVGAPNAVLIRADLRGVPGMDPSTWTQDRFDAICPLKNGAPSQFPNCDLNRDSKIIYSNSDGSCGGAQYSLVQKLECECNVACQNDPWCSEQSNLRLYGQWSGVIVGSAGELTKVGLVTNMGVPDWAPEDHPGVYLQVSGILDQVRAARPSWQVLAAEGTDLCCKPVDPNSPDADTLCPPEKRCP